MRDEIDVGDVGGKGGEILLDGLRVADVGEDGIADGQVGALGRNGNSGLGHENQQAHGFEADGFAAGVGAADDELTVSRVHLQRERHDGLATRAQIALHHRMPCVDEDERVGGCPSASNRDASATDTARQSGPWRIATPARAATSTATRMASALLAEARGHLQQDAVNLALLVFQQADEFVVLLDGFEGLDEDGLAAGAGAVNDALHAAFLLDL